MPQSIRRIAQKHLSSPVEITIETKTVTAPTINQRYIPANGYAKNSKRCSACSRSSHSTPC